MTMIKVRCCNECPFVLPEDATAANVSYCTHPIDEHEWPPVRRPAAAPPEWCPLRERETIVVIGGV